MNRPRPEVQALSDIKDPVVRAATALVATEEARELMSAIAEVRARAIYEVYKSIGGSAAARVLGLNRAKIHRIVREQEPNDPDPAVQAVLARRRAATSEGIEMLMKTFASAQALAESRRTEGRL